MGKGKKRNRGGKNRSHPHHNGMGMKKKNRGITTVSASLAAGMSVRDHLRDSLRLAAMASSTISLGRGFTFGSSQRILLVGEGNFSFASSLATSIGGTKILATSLDEKEQVVAKYGVDAQTSLSTIVRLGGKVLHGVDGTTMDGEAAIAADAPFDRIIFNFPHLGGATQEDLARVREMLAGFFRACVSLAAPFPQGFVCVSLRDTLFYRSWKIEELAADAGLRLEGRVPFDGEKFAELGYSEARTNPAFRNAPVVDNASIYIFGHHRKWQKRAKTTIAKVELDTPLKFDGAPQEDAANDAKRRAKRVRAIKKKLRHIDALKEKDALDANQQAKLASESALREELVALDKED